MKHLRTDSPWLDRLVPEGIPVPSSIVISGPGGSGKPLVGLALASAWLRRGGNLVFMTLQYPDRSFVENDLKQLYGMDLPGFSDKVAFLRLDLDLEVTSDKVYKDGPGGFRGNFVNPSTLERGLKRAEEILGPSEMGTLVFASALNMLLFSPTYGEKMLAYLEGLLREDRTRTYLFTLSSTANKEAVARLENAADHLLMAQMTRPDRFLHLRVERVRGASFVGEQIRVPFGRPSLEKLKRTADEARVVQIPAISKI